MHISLHWGVMGGRWGGAGGEGGANLVQLLAGFQAGRGLCQGPGALDLPLGNAHRAVVGQHCRGAVPQQPYILTQHLGAESGA